MSECSCFQDVPDAGCARHGLRADLKDDVERDVWRCDTGERAREALTAWAHRVQRAEEERERLRDIANKALAGQREAWKERDEARREAERWRDSGHRGACFDRGHDPERTSKMLLSWEHPDGSDAPIRDEPALQREMKVSEEPAALGLRYPERNGTAFGMPSVDSALTVRLSMDALDKLEAFSKADLVTREELGYEDVHRAYLEGLLCAKNKQIKGAQHTAKKMSSDVAALREEFAALRDLALKMAEWLAEEDYDLCLPMADSVRDLAAKLKEAK